MGLVVQMAAEVWYQFGALDCKWDKDFFDNVHILVFDMEAVHKTFLIGIAPDATGTNAEDCLLQVDPVCSKEAMR
jgi:hypothetical protein